MTKSQRTLVIAEAGVNHNGSFEMAQRLVRAAKDAGADIVKFQTFRADTLASLDAPMASYQKQATEGQGIQYKSQYGLLKDLELNDESHLRLAELCGEIGIEFLSTPFDLESLWFLTDKVKVNRIKLSSGDLTNGPLILSSARTGLPILLSTGMATFTEIEMALNVVAFGFTEISASDPQATLELFEPGGSTESFQKAYLSKEGRNLLKEKLTLLQCTTEYPCLIKNVNLNAMLQMRNKFGIETGFSDHTASLTASLAAVAIGASVIEKHLTLDKSLPGPDHSASLEPAEFKDLVDGIREVELMLGSFEKAPSENELSNIPAARKSLVAARDIPAGKIIDKQDLAIRRPGTGLSPMRYWEIIGSQANRNYRKDELI